MSQRRHPVRSAPLSGAVILACAVCGLSIDHAQSETGREQEMSGQVRPIHKHPVNLHYLEFRGKPTILVTSAEHYGALVNLDFDYESYLGALADRGMNLTRVFAGTYVEGAGDWGGGDQVLAVEPGPDHFICPWAWSDEAWGYHGVRFDLSRWNEAYFDRLHDLLSVAEVDV